MGALKGGCIKIHWNLFMDLITIVGFILTTGTFVVALNVKSKLREQSEKQQFLRSRERTLWGLSGLRDSIKESDVFTKKLLHDVCEQLYPLTLYSFWKKSHSSTIQNAHDKAKEVLLDDTKRMEAKEEIVLNLSNVITIVEKEDYLTSNK